jgi:hypothetical protein
MLVVVSTSSATGRSTIRLGRGGSGSSVCIICKARKGGGGGGGVGGVCRSADFAAAYACDLI